MVAQAARQRASSLAGRVQGLVDRLAPPDTRKQVSSNLYNFANEQPVLASFALVQFTLSAVPILLFTSFTFGTLVLSLFAALAFSLFWIGVAILVLIPTLFLTFSLGVIVWLWAVGSWISLRLIYRVLNSAMGGVPEVKASVETRDGVTSVSTIPSNGAPTIERKHAPHAPDYKQGSDYKAEIAT